MFFGDEDDGLLETPKTRDFPGKKKKKKKIKLEVPQRVNQIGGEASYSE